MSIGSTSICHIAFVTSDIEKMVKNWAQLLGVEKPIIKNIPSKEKAPALTEGILEDYKDTKIAVFQLENTKIEIVEPGDEPSPWKTFLEKHGEGVQHLAFKVPDREKAEEELKNIESDNRFHIGYYPNGTYAFYDSIAALGVEINIKTDDDNTELIQKLLQ